MAKQLDHQVQLDIAVKSLVGNITKKEIAELFNVSIDSVRRYSKKWEEYAQDVLSKEAEAEAAKEKPAKAKSNIIRPVKSKMKEKIVSVPVEEAPKSSMEEIMETLNDNQRKVITDFYAKRSENTDYVYRVGTRGRNPDGVKSIRQIVMEVIDKHFMAGTLIKENRTTIIKEIMEATSHNRVQSAKYFSGYKKLFGGYQDK